MELYRNPIKRQGDFADPFVLRYNGKYYLYATNPDIRCWSSENLISWVSEGPVISPDVFPELVPFAPEVVYWNGAFYLYTSPHGRGHFVLKSDRPTGPFHKISENVGHSIDGSIFIDDDGRWYFYWADDNGILGCEMRSPTEFGEPVQTGVFLHGWTEGPMVVKENGMYYMTYTGNHYLSRGYRIHAATSRDPLAGFRDCPDNPIIVHAEGDWTGLGHSSTVIGPNMLTHYIVYHNINEDLTRDLNIDPLILGSCMRVAGPSTLPQPVPEPPQFEDRTGAYSLWEILDGSWNFRDGLLYTMPDFQCRCKRAPNAESGIIEFHLQAVSEDGSYGISVGDLQIGLTPGSNTISLVHRSSGARLTYDIPYPFVHQALHCLQIRYYNDSLSLRIDGKHAGEYPFAVHAGDAIGYFANGSGIGIGYTAFHGGDSKSAEERIFYPVPCTIPLTEQRAQMIRLNIANAGEHHFAVVGRSVDSNSELQCTIDGESLPVRLVAANCDAAVYALLLPCGLKTLSVQLGAWLHAPSTLTVTPAHPFEPAREQIAQLAPFEKCCFGSARGSVTQATLEFPAGLALDAPSVGILLSASELAYGGEGQDMELGQNFFIGYCVSLDQGDLVLTKHRYDETELACVSLDRGIFPVWSMRAVQTVNDIAVFVNGSLVPLLSYHDNHPILFGKTGICAKSGGLMRAVFRSDEADHISSYGGQQ